MYKNQKAILQVMSETKYRVNEIFYSIDGEGIRTGSLAVFVRLAGCNLRCTYCDTAYALNKEEGKDMTADEIVDNVLQYRCNHVTLTGGEPLTQDCHELIQKLAEHGIHTNIETNGSIYVKPYQSENTTITMDWKTPASGMEELMMQTNLPLLRENDVLKFVCAEDDLPEVTNILNAYHPRCWVYLSPIFGKINPEKLVEYLKECPHDTEKIRVQIQLHKIIWNPDKRGV